MRILQLCLSDGHGGLELYVARLCALLRQRGHACSAAVAPGTMLAGRLADQGVPVTEWRVRVQPLPLVAAVRLARLLEREQVDILHVNWAKDLPLAALAKRLSRRPVRLIHSRHMSITRPKRDPYHRFLYGSLDRLIVLSELMRQEARRFLPITDSAAETIYLGGPAPDAVAHEEPSPSRPLKIALFGRIEPAKGQHLLIEAVDLLRERGVEAHAQIIGHAMDDAYLASLQADVARRGLRSRVTFAGFHPSPQRIMPTFDVVVLATNCETFGLVLVEAMRCGVAVVGTDAGGVPEIIEHGESGLLFQPGSAESLADRLQYLGENPDARCRLAAAGRERADRLFSDERHVLRLEVAMAAVSRAR